MIQPPQLFVCLRADDPFGPAQPVWLRIRQIFIGRRHPRPGEPIPDFAGRCGRTIFEEVRARSGGVEYIVLGGPHDKASADAALAELHANE